VKSKNIDEEEPNEQHQYSLGAIINIGALK
jgi:hypothetical protein